MNIYGTLKCVYIYTCTYARKHHHKMTDNNNSRPSAMCMHGGDEDCYACKNYSKT